jgi:hypothetical protein
LRVGQDGGLETSDSVNKNQVTQRDYILKKEMESIWNCESGSRMAEKHREPEATENRANAFKQVSGFPRGEWKLKIPS